MNEFKKVKDVKAGDIIYYYDHGKIHKQEVESAEIVTKHFVGADWCGHKIEYDEMYYVIKPKRSQEIKLREYEANSSIFRANCMIRFTNKEAVNLYLGKLKEKYEMKIAKLNRALKRYERLCYNVKQTQINNE